MPHLQARFPDKGEPMKTKFRKPLTLFLLLGLSAFSTSFGFSSRSKMRAHEPSLTTALMPQQATRTVNIPGLENRVTVRRDERGIPYIEATNDADLYFAQGYVTANDRLWQMDLMRRTARGELAEVLTAGPNNLAVEQDKQHRTMGFAQEVAAELAQASTQSRAILEAYARGVNAYIASLDPKSMPPEFQILQYKPRPWAPADSLLPVKLFGEAL